MKIKKLINKINKWLKDITNLLTNVFMFAVISGLLFNDPFGVISTMSNLISNVSERGLAGIICLSVILMYRK
jgi:phage-related protein